MIYSIRYQIELILYLPTSFRYWTTSCSLLILALSSAELPSCITRTTVWVMTHKKSVGTGLIINHVQVINCHNSLCDESCTIVLSTHTRRQKTHVGTYTQARIKVCSRNNNDKITQNAYKNVNPRAGAKGAPEAAITVPVFTLKD